MADLENIPRNCRVTITTRNGSTFTGTLHDVHPSAGKIILKNVTTAGVKLFGPQHYYASEMTNLQFLEGFQGVNAEQQSSKKTKSSKQQLTARKLHQPHLDKLRQLDTDDLAMSNIFAEENGDQGIGSGDDAIDDFEDYYETKDYTLICRICDKFYDAIVHIMEQDMVGLSFEGVEIGRNGTLSLIQVATNDALIIFDILRLGEEALKEGLEALFESRKVIKVIHDCRWMSDMIHNQFHMRLENVFDTQVANAFVYRTVNGGDWPRYVESLPACLVSHLNLSLERAHFMKIRDRAREKDESVWLQRPIPEKLLEAASKDVTYLIGLHKVLINKLLMEFTTGVEIYMHHVGNMRGEIEKCKNNVHMLPYAFMDIQKLVRINFSEHRKPAFVMHDSRGFRDNNVDITDKQIVFSHDSVWHRSEESKVLTDEKKKKWTPKHKSSSDSTTQDRKNEDSSKNSKPFGVWESQATGGNINIAPGVNACAQRAEKQKIGQRGNHSVSPHVNRNVTQDASESVEKTNKTDTFENIKKSTPPRAHFSAIPTEIKKVDNEQPPGQDNVCEALRASKIWQLVHGRKQNMPVESSHSVPQPSLSNNSKLTNELKQDAEKSGDDRKDTEAAAKFQKAMAQMENLQFVGVARNKIVTMSPEKLKGFGLMPSNLEEAENHTSSTSSGISQNHTGISSDIDGPVTFPKPSPADTLREQGLKMSDMMPAGSYKHVIGKKEAKRMKQQAQAMKYKSKSGQANEQKSALTSHDEDLCCIPMHPVLKRHKEIPLGMTDFGFGEIPEDGSFQTFKEKENSKSYIQRQLLFNDENSIKDEDLKNFEQSDTFKRVLKLASISSKGSLKNKLLPAKNTSPSPGS